MWTEKLLVSVKVLKEVITILNNIRKKRLLGAIIILVFMFGTIAIVYYRVKKENKLLNNYYIYLYPNSLEKNNLLVEVKALECRESLKILGCKLCKYGIQPVSIVINNKSSGIYYFTKRELNPSYMRAQDSFLRCFGKKNTADGFIPILREKFKIINAQKKHVYLSKEIADDFIYPRRIKKGILFFAQFKKTEKLIIPLVNKDTGERITFEFLAN